MLSCIERHYNYELESKKIIQNKRLLLRKLEQLQRRQGTVN